MTRQFRSAVRLLPVLACLLAFAGCSGKQSRHLRRADAHFEAGDLEKAKIEYMNVLRLDTANTHVIGRLGEIWSAQGSPVRALPFLYKRRELVPSDLDSRLLLAKGFLTLGQAGEARKEANAILAADPLRAGALLVLGETAQSESDASATRKAAEAFPESSSAERHLVLAMLLQRDGDADAAAREVELAVKADPTSIPARMARGASFLAAGDKAAAEREIAGAAELAPARSPFRMQLAAYRLAQGDREGALRVADEVVSDAPDYLPAWIFKAAVALGADEYDETASLLGSVFAIDPDNPEARLLEAQMHTAKGEPAEAVAILQRLQSRFPDLPGVILELARAHETAGEPDLATRVLDDAIAKYPDFTRAVLYSADIRLRSGNGGAAIAPLTRLLENNDSLKSAESMLAAALMQADRSDEATALLRRLVESSPDNPDYRFRLGLLLADAGQADDARGMLEAAVRLDPSNARALARLVELDRSTGDPTNAIARVDAFLVDHPDSPQAHFLKGRLLVDLREWPAAAAAVSKALELDPQFGEARELLARIHATDGEIPQAIDVLKAGLEFDPGNTRTLRSLAILYTELKDYPNLRDTCAAILEIEPDAVDVLNNLATLYIERFDDPDKALELAEKARQLRPGVAMATGVDARQEAAAIADTLAWIRYRRGEYAEALALSREAAGPLDSHPVVLFHLGMAAYMSGDLETAGDALARATADAPGEPWTPEATGRLERIRSLNNLTADQLEAEANSGDGDAVIYSRLAELRLAGGNCAGAAEAWQEALRLNPSMFGAVAGLAELHTGPLPDPAKAAELAAKAREIDPDNPRVARLFAAIALNSGEHRRAYTLLKQNPAGTSDPAALKLLVRAACGIGNIPEARDAAGKLLAASPGDAQAAGFLQLTAPAADDAAFAALADAAARALEADPDSLPAQMVQAAALVRRGDAGAAEAKYRELLARYPDSAAVRRDLAALCARNPETREEAAKLATLARETLPDDPGPARTLGILASYRQDYAYAVQLLQESDRSEPLDATGRYYLGIAQLGNGSEKAGRESLHQARAAGLPQALADEAARILDSPPAGSE